MDYDKLRELAIVDAKRRLRLVEYRLRSWDIVDRLNKKQENIGKMFIFQLGNKDWEDKSFINITFNEYATLREIKYIVWRFGIVKEELRLK